MSNHVTAIVKRRVVGSATRKAILMYMADNASEDGSGIWSSKITMAADLEMTRRSVQRHTLEMIDQGLISEVGRRKCSRGYTLEYCINLAAIKALKSTRDTESHVTDVHPTCDTGTHLHATESHINRSRTTLGTEKEAIASQKNGADLFDEPPPKPKQKRATSIPENWVPSDRNIADALSKNLSQQQIQNEGEKFRDHHTARGTTFKNWDAAWRTWVGNSLKFAAGRGSAPQRRGMAGRDVAEEIATDAIELARKAEAHGPDWGSA